MNTTLLRVFTLAFTLSALVARAQIDAGFNPAPNGRVDAVVEQADGKLLAVGQFTTIAGAARNGLARLNADGSIDAAFNPAPDNACSCVAVQADGKIIVGGAFGNIAGSARNRLARLNADGTLDATFDPNLNGAPNGLALEPDGQLVVVGEFTMIGATPANRIARLNANGTFDWTPGTGANAAANGAAVQPDGKIVVWGQFATINGVAQASLARLTDTGAVDVAFAPVVNNTVLSAAVQPDGKIVFTGPFTMVNSTTRLRVARVDAAGVLDAGYNPEANIRPFSTSLQADGAAVISGEFTNVGGNTRSRLARISAAGAIEAFNPNANDDAFAVTVQNDGKVIAGGVFTQVSATPRTFLARVLNDPAVDVLDAPTPARVEWLRNATAPEVHQVEFDLSTNGGMSWTLLGAGTRIVGGWELTGQSLPIFGQLRARARTLGGQYAGSTGYISSTGTFSFATAPTVVTQAASSINSTTATVNGTVNANGADATVTFEYGTVSGGPYSAIAGTPSPVTGVTATPVSAGLTLLTPATTYYFRAKAVNVEGTTFGSELSFTTSANNPPVPGTFAITPASPVPANQTLTATFTGWTDAELHYPLEYEVREGGTVIVPFGASATPTFMLAQGTHLIKGRVRDSLGAITETAEETVMVTSPEPITSLVAIKNQQVPGEPSGTVFYSFGPPAIDAAGHIAVKAKIKAAASLDAIVKFPGGVLARKTGAAPDATGAASAETFAGFKDPFISGGEVGFLAKLAGGGVSPANDYALFVTDGGVLKRVLREGDVAPETGGATFRSVASFSLQGSEVVVLGKLTPGTGAPVVDTPNDLGLWTQRPLGGYALSLALREQQAFGLQTVKAFKALGAVSGTPGNARNHTLLDTLTVPVEFTDGVKSVLSIAHAPPAYNATTLATLGGPVGPPSTTWKKFGVPAGTSAANTFGLRATVTVGGSDQVSLISGVSGSQSILVTTGDAATDNLGAPIAGLTFAAFKDPAIEPSTAARMVWPAKLAGTGVTSTSDDALYASDGSLVYQVAREGSPALIAGENWRVIKSSGLWQSDPRGPLFTAFLAGGSVTKLNDFGLWGISSAGTMYQLLREGVVLNLDGNPRTVKSLKVLTAVSGSPGVTRSMNGDTVVAQLGFTDGAQAVVKVQVP